MAQARLEEIERFLYYGRWMPIGLLSLYPFGLWCWASSPARSTPVIRKIGKVDYWLLTWLAVIAVSATYSIKPSATVQTAITFIAMYVAVFWAAWNYVDRFGEARLISLLIVAVLPIYVVSWATVLGGGSGGVGGYVNGRFMGVLENPNSLGLLTALVMPLFIGRALNRSGISDYSLAVAIVGTLIITGSRGSIVAAAVGSFYLVWKLKNIGKLQSLLLIAVGVAVAVYFLQGAFEALVIRPEQLQTGSGRLTIWEHYTQYISNRPILGHGWGTEDLLHRYYGTDLNAVGVRGQYAASSYIGIASQIGVIPSIVFFVPFTLMVFRACRVPPGTHLGLHVSTAVIIVGLITGLVESWMSSVGNAQALIFWLAVMLVARYLYSK